MSPAVRMHPLPRDVIVTQIEIPARIGVIMSGVNGSIPSKIPRGTKGVVESVGSGVVKVNLNYDGESLRIDVKMSVFGSLFENLTVKKG